MGKRYSGTSMAMSQQIITTCDLFIKLLDSTMKQKNHEKALILWRKIFGEEHGDVATS